MDNSKNLSQSSSILKRGGQEIGPQPASRLIKRVRCPDVNKHVIPGKPQSLISSKPQYIVNKKHGIVLKPELPIMNIKKMPINCGGWIPIPKNSIVKHNGNPFITNIRKLLRTDNPFVDKENKTIHTMPARFSEKLDMYGFECFLTSQLCPKVVSKLIYLITRLGQGVTDASKIDNLRMSDFDHSYVGLNKPTEGYKMMTPEYEPIPMPANQLLEFDFEQCGKEQDMLLKIKKKIDIIGGWITYCRLNSQLRPDAFGRVTIKKKKIEMYPCDLVPMKQCNYCGCLNLYSQYPGGAKIHNSTKHYDEKWKEILAQQKLENPDMGLQDLTRKADELRGVDKNPYTTKFSGDTAEVFWRCCMCQGDLNTLILTTLASIWIFVKMIWKALFVLCGQLDELMKMGYGDVYDELTETQKISIRSHDKMIIKEFMFHMRVKIIQCGNDLDDLHRSMLGRNLQHVYCTHDGRLNSFKPELIVDIALANKIITQATREAHHEIRYNIIPNHNNLKLHNTNFVDWCFKNSTSNLCNTSTRCEHEDRRFIHYGFACGQASILEIILTCTVQGNTFIILPNIQQNGKFKDDTGYLFEKDKKIHLFIEGATQPLVMEGDTLGILTHYDCLLFKDKYYMLTTEVTLDFVVIKAMTGPYDKLEQLPTHTTISTSHKEIKLCLPSITGVMGNWQGVNFQENTFELDMPLFRALCLRNLSGKVSFENAREFAVGYAIRNFVVKSKKIANAHIQYNDIDIHVLLSQICMLTLRGNFTRSIKFSELMRNVGPLRGIMPALERTFTSICVFGITEFIHYITGLEMVSIISMLSKSCISNWIDGFCSSKFWENLLLSSEDMQLRDLKFFSLETDQELEKWPSYKEQLICLHHSSDCEHNEGDYKCDCCGMQCESMLCKCCQTDGKFFFWDYADKEIKQEEERISNRNNIQHERLLKAVVGQKRTSVTETGTQDLDKVKSKSRIEPMIEIDDKMVKTLEFITETTMDYKPEWQYLPPTKRTYQAISVKPTQMDMGDKMRQETQEKLLEVMDKDNYDKVFEIVPMTGPKIVDENEQTKTTVQQTKSQIDEEPVEIDSDQPKIQETVEQWRDVVKKSNRLTTTTKNLMKEAIKESTEADIDALIIELLPLMGDRFIKHVTNPIMFEGLCNTESGKFYNLEHIPVGITIYTPPNIFSVIEQHYIPNSADDSCGYDAYVNATGSKIPADMFNLICEKSNKFFDTDLILVAKQENRNIIILTENHTIIARHDAISNKFASIQLIPPSPEAEIGHFVRCKIKRQNAHCIMMYSDSFEDHEKRKGLMENMGIDINELSIPSTLTPKQVLQIEYAAVKYKQQVNRMYSTKLGMTMYKGRDDNYFVTNNATHQHMLINGEFNVEIDKTLIPVIQILMSVMNSDCKETSIPGQFHKPAGLPMDLELFRHEAILDLIRELCRSRDPDTFLDEQNVRAHHAAVIRPWRGASALSLVNRGKSKLKLLDKVMINIKNRKFVTSIVGMVQPEFMLDINLLKSEKVEVIELKLSHGSILRSILSLIKKMVTGNVFRNIIKDTAVILGPAGCGKSTDIAEKVKPGDVVLAMTTEAVNNLKNKVRTTSHIYSVEAFKTMDLGRDYNLFIDEATMLDWLALWPLVQEKTSVTLYGSHLQVGHIDTSSTPGVRNVDSVISVVPPTNTMIWSHTYRIGEPMVSALKTIDKSLTSRSKHKTEIRFTMCTWEDRRKISVIVSKTNPDVILCMYNKVKAELGALLGDSVNKIYTTHAFQGNEVEHSLVILKGEKEGMWGLNGDSNYLYSALTRASRLCHIIVVDYPMVEPHNIDQLITKRTGGAITELKDDDLLTVYNMHTLTSEEVEALNQLEITVKGATLSYELIDGGVRCISKFHGIEVAKIENVDGEISVTGNEIAVRLFQENKDKPLEVRRSELHTTFKTSSIIMATRSVNRLKELGWIVDKHPIGIIQLKLNDSVITIKKGPGCPTMSSYEFTDGTDTIIISSAWKRLLKRELKVRTVNKTSDIGIIAQWLELPGLEYEPLKTYADTWLWMLQGDMKVAISQYLERLSNMHIWILNALSMNDMPKCHNLMLKNMYQYNRYVKHDKNKSIGGHQSVMPHKTYISDAKLWFSKRKYTLIAKTGKLMSINIDESDKSYREFVVEALADLWFDEPKDVVKGIDLDNLEIPGLFISLAKHMQEGGDIAQNVKSTVTSLLLEYRAPTSDYINVNNTMKRDVTQLIHSELPRQQIMGADMLTHLSPCEIIIEQVCQNHLFKLNYDSSCNMMYGGPFLLGLSYNSLYHVKLLDMDDHPNIRFNFNLQWATYNDMMVSRYKSALVKPNVVDIIADTSKGGILLMGVDIVSHNNEWLIGIMKSNMSTKIIGAVPTNNAANPWYQIVNGKQIAYKNGRYSRHIKNDIVTRALRGKPLYVDQYQIDENLQTRYISIESMFDVAEHKIICLSWKNKPLEGYICRSVDTMKSMGHNIEVTVPWIDFNVMDILSTRSLITTRKLKINVKLLRTLLIRLITGDDSWNSLLNYARTVESTYIVTESKLSEMQAHTIPEVLNTAWYALFIHHNYIGKFKLLSALVNQAQNSELLLQLLNQIVPGLMNLMGVATNVIEETATNLIKKLAKFLKFDANALNAINTLSTVEWTKFIQQHRIVLYGLKDNQTEPTIIDATEDGDEQGDKRHRKDDEQPIPDKIIDNLLDKYLNDEATSEESSVGDQPMSKPFDQDMEPYDSDDEYHEARDIAKWDSESSVEDDAAISMDEDDQNLEDQLMQRELTSKSDLITPVHKPTTLKTQQIIDDSYVETTVISDTPEPHVPRHYIDTVKQDKLLSESGILTLHPNGHKIVDSLIIQHADADPEANNILTLMSSFINAIRDQSMIKITQTGKVNLLQLRRVKRKELNIKYIVKDNLKLPKVIWFYWHDDELPLLIWKMVTTCSEVMYDYDIILLTNSTYTDYLPVMDYNPTKIGLAQWSDLIRYKLLAKYGGIYIDTTTIVTDTFQPIIDYMLDAKKEFFQFSNRDYREINKSMENWFIISTVDCEYTHWVAQYNEEMCAANITDKIALQYWLIKRFGTELAEVAIRCVSHSNMVYLRSYVIQQLVTLKHKINTNHCVFANESPIIFWNSKHEWSWQEKLSSLWTKPVEDLIEMQPLIKLINNLWRPLILYDDLDKECAPNSILGKLKSQRFKYMNCCSNLGLFKHTSDKKFLDISSHLSVYRPDAVIICIGSTGDLLPCIFITRLLTGNSKKVCIITHRDHAPFINATQPTVITLPLSINSETLMCAGISFLTKLTVADGSTANQIHNIIFNEITEYLNNMGLEKSKVIVTGLVPNLQTLMTRHKSGWIITNPFPLTWVAGDSNDSIKSFVKNMTARLLMNIKDRMTKSRHKQKEEVQEPKILYTYNRMLISEGDVYDSNVFKCGPLPGNLLYVTPDIPMDEFCLIMLGSCFKYYNQSHLCALIKLCMRKNFKVVIVATQSIKPYTHLENLVKVYNKAISIVSQINIQTDAKRIRFVINHGGAGTINECIKAKCIPVCWPIFADQPYWAKKTTQIGIGWQLLGSNEEELIKEMEEFLTREPYIKENLDNFETDTGDVYELMEIINDIDPLTIGNLSLNSKVELNHGEISKEDMNETIYAGFPENIGFYVCRNFYNEETTNIVTADKCGYLSFKSLLNHDGKIKLERSMNPQIMHLKAQQTTVDDLIEATISVGCNVAIKKDNVLTLYKVFKTCPTIAYNIITASTHLHCEPITKIETENWEANLVNTMDAMRFEKELKKIINSLEATLQIPSMLLINPEMTIRWVGPRCMSDCQARLNLNSAVPLKQRRGLNCLSVTLKCCNGIWHTTTTRSDQGLRLCIVLGINGWTVATYIIKEELLVIFVDKPISNRNIIIDMNKSIAKERLITTKRSTQSITVMLNEATKNHVKINHRGIYCDKIHDSSLKDYVLVVTCYDNRSHHMYDEAMAIRGARSVIDGEENIQDMARFEASFNQPFNRLVMVNMIDYYLLETDTVPDGKSIEVLIMSVIRLIKTDSPRTYIQYKTLLRLTRSGTNLYTKTMLDNDIIDVIQIYYKPMMNKLVSKYELNVPARTNQDDLLAAMIRDLASWDKLVECMVEITRIFGKEPNELVVTERTLQSIGSITANDLLAGYTVNKDSIWLMVASKFITKSTPGGGNLKDVTPAILRDYKQSETSEILIKPESVVRDFDEDRQSWKSEVTIKKVTSSNKWNINEDILRKAITETTLGKKFRPKPANRLDTVPEFKELTYLNLMTYSEANYNTNVEAEMFPNKDCKFLDLFIAPYSYRYCADNIDVVHDCPSMTDMILWDNTDLTNWLTIYAPLNEMKIVSREMPMHIIEVEKHTLKQYPQMSRPVLTKVCYEEIRSIAGRLGSVYKLRKKQPDINLFSKKLAATYFNENWTSQVNNYKANPIIIEPNDVRKWIADNKSCPDIIKELGELLAAGMCIKPLSDVNVHLKLESLLKDQPIKSWREQQARIIVWQRKAVCAIYTSVFVKAKQRLKDILKYNILYTDGLRPDEISARLRLTKRVVGFFENDLTKQDRQTDEPIIEVEMMMYDLLGVHKNVISSWRYMHDLWKFKSNYSHGTRTAMRLTGQATTALGNCITNMQVHCDFVAKNNHILELALFLGDDMCMVFRGKPDIKNLNNDIATEFNMQSKERWNNNYGTFCSMIVTKLEHGNCQMSPDVVRLKYRYEVTNGAHEVNSLNMLMRASSYLMMLGDLPEVKRAITLMNLPIQPIKWYDYAQMVYGCANKYGINEHQVTAFYHDLINMIERPTIWSRTFRHYSAEIKRVKSDN